VRQRVSIGYKCQENYWACPESADC